MRFFRKEKPKPPAFEVRVTVNQDALKVFEASFEGRPCYWSIGRATNTEKSISGEAKVVEGGGSGAYQAKRDFVWENYIYPKALPGWIPVEKAKESMSGAITMFSGSPIQTESKTLTDSVNISENIILTKDGITSTKTLSQSAGLKAKES